MEIKHELMESFPLITKVENSEQKGKVVVCGERSDLKKFWEAMKVKESVRVHHLLLLVNPEKTQCVPAEIDQTTADDCLYIHNLQGRENLAEIAQYAQGLFGNEPRNPTFPEEDQ
ncbi:MAG: hypothetical protein LBG52_01930 [Candidatus Peribacteria bacterium]|jgi:hypothetical protein|nr:hypothetical protein [Candidatus Peribacteria bacterium]